LAIAILFDVIADLDGVQQLAAHNHFMRWMA
jgi:hypothetical protein